MTRGRCSVPRRMKLIRSFVLAALTAVPLLAADAPAPESWSVDKTHSMVDFKVRHLVANVTGSFRDFDAVINLDRNNPAASNVEFTIQAKSIDTGEPKRDDHLRSADFFEVEKYPTIHFRSTGIKAKSKTEFDVTGDLTMHGVTKRMTLPVTFLGFGKDGRGNERAGFEIGGTIDRKDFGIVWNRALDEGGVVLGDDVKVMIGLSLVKKKAQ